MKKLIFTILIALLIIQIGYTQVGINNDGSAPDPSSLLDVKSTTKGVLIPRMAATDRDNISSPAKGLVVFVTDDNNFYYYNGTEWVNTATQPDLDWQINGNDMYALPSGNVGIGTITPIHKFDVESNSSTIVGHFKSTRASKNDIAVLGQVYNTDGYGIGGYFMGGSIGVSTFLSPLGNNTYYGLRSEVSGGSGINLGIYSTTSGTGSNYSVYGYTTTSYNKGSAGFFTNKDSTGIGILARGSNVDTYYVAEDGAAIVGTGRLRGIIGVTAEEDNAAVAVEGVYYATTNYNGTGIRGYSIPADNYGVGVKGLGGHIGVYGYGYNGFAGVVGVADGTTTYAIYAVGDIEATGTITSTANKATIIDHPLDPANKILKHFSIESNEVLNVYRGNIKLDGNGKAVVQLPSYFNAINANFSYNLTPIGAPAPGLYIEKEIDQKGNFVIAGGKPGQKISWYVYAERNDSYYKKHAEKKKAEVYKTGKMKGKYFHPELYGQSASKKIGYIAVEKIDNQKESLIKINDEKIDLKNPLKIKE